MQCFTLLLILVDTGLKELCLPLLVTGIHCTKLWVWKHICQYQWSWDKPYSPGCNHLCHMLQFGSKHVCIEDVYIFKHCREMTLFFWFGTYCISCVVQQTSGVKDLYSLVRYDDSSLAATRRCVSVYLGVVVLRVWYFEHALLQLKNCHHILPEKTNPLLVLDLPLK